MRMVRVIAASFAEECQEEQAEHIERGHSGCNHSTEPEHVMAIVPGVPEDFVFAEESGESGESRDG